MSVVVISDKDIALLEQYIDKKELANLKEKSAVRLSGPLVNSAPNGNYFRSLLRILHGLLLVVGDIIQVDQDSCFFTS